MSPTMAEPAELPDEIEARIAAAERMVAEDLAIIQESLDEIDAIPHETFDDPSVVRCVADLRTTVRTASRAIRDSDHPPLRRANTGG